MIAREKQLKRAKKEMEGLRKKLGSGRKRSPKTLERLRGRLQDLEADVAEYETLRTEGMAAISVKHPEDIMLFPVRYRIAKGMSVPEFAEMVNIPSRMIYRYEDKRYTNVMGTTLARIFSALPVGVKSEVRELN